MLFIIQNRCAVNIYDQTCAIKTGKRNWWHNTPLKGDVKLNFNCLPVRNAVNLDTYVYANTIHNMIDVPVNLYFHVKHD